MSARFFRLAASKTTDMAAIDKLHELENCAKELAAVEASFPERINNNKTKRGEKPTKLSRGNGEKLKEVKQDASEMELSLYKNFSQFETPSQIIRALHCASTNDLLSAESFLKYYHPDDLPLGEEIVEIKRKLLNMMAEFLAAYPGAED